MRFDPQSKMRGQFFYQWQPQVTGIYDVDLFSSILEKYPRDPKLLGWTAGPKIPDAQLVSLFSPHCETTRDNNISGGLAVIYAMYRLDQYIGLPEEQQFTRTIIRRNFEHGYLLAGLPGPENLHNSKYDGGDDVRSVYAFYTNREPPGSTDINRYGVGKVFRAGNFSILPYEPGPSEKVNRPQNGLIR